MKLFFFLKSPVYSKAIFRMLKRDGRSKSTILNKKIFFYLLPFYLHKDGINYNFLSAAFLF